MSGKRVSPRRKAGAQSPKRVVIVGAGPGGLAAALECVENGLDPRCVTIVEARRVPALQRNIVVDRFMLSRLARFGAIPPSLNQWDRAALLVGDAMPAAPVVIPGVATLRSTRHETAPSISVLRRTPEGVVQLADLNQSLRRAARRRGIRMLTATPVLGSSTALSTSRTLQVQAADGGAEISADMVILACGAGSRLLRQLGVKRIPVAVPLQSWLIAVVNGVGEFPVALRLVASESDGVGTCFSLSSRSQTSIAVRLAQEQVLDREAAQALARLAALQLRIPGAVVEAFTYETRMDRAAVSSLGADCVLLGDALRRSDVTYGGGANAAFADAWWLGRLVGKDLPLERYLAEVSSTTQELVTGSWTMRLLDGLVEVGRSGLRLWPAPLRQVGDLTLNLWAQGLATAATMWQSWQGPSRGAPRNGTHRSR